MVWWVRLVPSWGGRCVPAWLWVVVLARKLLGTFPGVCRVMAWALGTQLHSAAQTPASGLVFPKHRAEYYENREYSKNGTLDICSGHRRSFWWLELLLFLVFQPFKSPLLPHNIQSSVGALLSTLSPWQKRCHKMRSARRTDLLQDSTLTTWFKENDCMRSSGFREYCAPQLTGWGFMEGEDGEGN